MTQTIVGSLITVGVALFVFGLVLSMAPAPTAFMVTGGLVVFIGIAVSWHSGIEHEVPVQADTP